ncbi:hypothetical protein D3C87_2143550 [compost metagenome]
MLQIFDGLADAPVDKLQTAGLCRGPRSRRRLVKNGKNQMAQQMFDLGLGGGRSIQAIDDRHEDAVGGAGDMARTGFEEV